MLFQAFIILQAVCFKAMFMFHILFQVEKRCCYVSIKIYLMLHVFYNSIVLIFLPVSTYLQI